MYVKDGVKLSAQLCAVLRWMGVVKLQSSPNYLYKNALQSDPSSVGNRPDCKKLIIHEMPHAFARHDSVVRMH